MQVVLAHADPGVRSRFDRVLSHVASEIFKSVMTATLFTIAILVYYVPFVGPPLSLLNFTLLYAFNAFEYLWLTQHVPLRERLARVESRWIYYAAFGICWRSGRCDARSQ